MAVDNSRICDAPIRPAGRSQFYLLLAAAVSFAMPALRGQVIDPFPGFLADLAGQVKLPAEFSFEQQIQIGLQANSSTANPFAYWHAVQIREWIHYDGVKNITLTGGMTYIDYFNVAQTDSYGHHEWLATGMGTLKQSLSGGSIYEQLRYELQDFRDSHGQVQTLPRLRIRFGQNLYLGESGAKPYLGFYEEAIMQFPSPSYSRVTFEGARFFAGGGFRFGSRTTALVGFKAQAEVASNGSTVALYFGPAFAIEYTFRRDRLLREEHQRTTAFKDF